MHCRRAQSCAPAKSNASCCCQSGRSVVRRIKFRWPLCSRTWFVWLAEILGTAFRVRDGRLTRMAGVHRAAWLGAAVMLPACASWRCEARFAGPPTRVAVSVLTDGAPRVDGNVRSRKTHAVLGSTTVTLLDSMRREIVTVTASDSGEFTLPLAKPGHYSVRFRSLGYQSTTTPVNVVEHQAARLLVELAISTTMSPTPCTCRQVTRPNELCV